MMHPDIHSALVTQHVADLHRTADRFRLRRRATRARRPAESLEPVTIRAAVEGDRHAIQQLAELDAKPVPAARPVVAFRAGQLVVVFDPETGTFLTDPFVPSATTARIVRDVVEAELASAA